MSSEFDPEVGSLSVNGQPDPPGRMRCAPGLAACFFYAAVVWDAAILVNYAGILNVGAAVTAINWTVAKTY